MVSATDGSAFTGSVTVSVTGDAGTQATGSVGAGACTHEGNGYHTYAPAQAETNYDLIAFTFTGTGAIPATVQVYTITGDAFARLGAPAGASVSADILVIDNFVDGLESTLGAAGAGLTAVPWNAAWDAEVQSEVDDALVAQRLDELINADSDIDGVAPPTVGSVIHELMTKTAGSFTYDQTTDSLEALRDRGDAAWADSGAPPSAATVAAAVWDEDATGHQTGGTFGQAIGDPGVDTNTIFKAVVIDATSATVGLDVVAVKSALNVVDATVGAILTDTSEIGTAGAGLTNINLPNQTMDIIGSISGNLSGSVGSVTGAVGSIAVGGIATTSFAAGAIDAAAIAASAIGASEIADGAIDAATFAAGAITAAAIATDAIDADALAADAVTEIWTKAIAELAQATPSATPSVLNAIAMLYMIARNAVTVTSTTKSFTNDAGTVIIKKALSDDGTTYTEAEAVAGP